MSIENEFAEPPILPPRGGRRANGIVRTAAVVAASGLVFAAGFIAGDGHSEEESPGAPASTLEIPDYADELLTLEQQVAQLQRQLSNTQQADKLLVDIAEQGDMLIQLQADSLGIRPEVLRGELPKVESFPGFGRAIESGDRVELEGSTLEIGLRPKAIEGAQWAPHCTANKIAYNGVDYVLTAAHCFKDANYSIEGYESGSKGGMLFSSLDITDASPNEYAILDPNLPLDRRTQEPVTVAERVLVSYLGDDVAVLVVEQTPEFNQFSALDKTSYADYEVAPIVGESVAFSSAPAASNFELIHGAQRDGVYLGRIDTLEDTNPGILSTVEDFVGIKNVPENTQDPCMYGASGSSAVTASGIYLGPLSNRSQVDEYMDGGFDPYASPAGSFTNSLRYADVLDVDLGEFDVLCGYSTFGSNAIDNLLQFSEPAVTYLPTEVQNVGGK